ncbi:MAG: GNAT family N-acetyltransferase [Gammaproteobacteria bacterium]|nr:GNAT family N-acetyltransferase [Gammaproteobacteria bacterium]
MNHYSDKTLYQRARRLLAPEGAFFAQASTAGRTVNWPGIFASVNVAAPDRSIFNWVVQDDAQQLRAHYDDIERTYNDAGIRSWTVWVDGDDAATAKYLSERGHVLDAEPNAMGAAMTELTLPEIGDLRWEPSKDGAVIGRINDQAFGFPPPAFAALLEQWPSENWQGYLGYSGNEPVATVSTYMSDDGDCGICGVAALPQAQGKGITKRLLAVALEQAHNAGAVTTSLQATPSGAPLYQSLGFRDVGILQMWEKKKARP